MWVSLFLLFFVVPVVQERRSQYFHTVAAQGVAACSPLSRLSDVIAQEIQVAVNGPTGALAAARAVPSFVPHSISVD
jgi:hypothetical protein